ncbi:MAG: M23 family metallopeptidase [Lachnospiraceae bacterium]|nr:M23 family metallopeptidase [Lachnospiraceae bacterium]
MKKSKFYRIFAVTYIKTAIVVILLNILFFPSFHRIADEGDTLFAVQMQGEEIGYAAGVGDAEKCFLQARRMLAQESAEMVFTDVQVSYEGQARLFGVISSEEELTQRMYEKLKQNIRQTRKKAYTLKINDFTVNIQTSADIQKLLQAALDKYGAAGKYEVELVLDSTRELNVLTTQIRSIEEKQAQEEQQKNALTQAGVGRELSQLASNMDGQLEKDFEDYDLGLTAIGFGDKIEVVEAYLPERSLTSLEKAIETVTKEQEKNTIYEVAAGDTLSGIALKTDISVDKIIAMNETLEDENSMIRIGDELIVTVPEPELSVTRTEEIYYEEDYDADIEYIYNDSWYTTESVTRQEPSSGHRRVIASVAYRNDSVSGRDIIKEEVTLAAVPKIVEIGTKTPPTYIKPISGGRFSSGFKRRWGRMHKGVDWATPVGTAVMASSGGTVAKAGWGSGYGYVIYINHADGRQTRYGHLSKILVKAGQTVKQGQKIALSGNTGRSTGPHVHFEILIGGTQVNPLQYMN